MRARHAGALVVLGSATPSLESYYNAQNGRYALSTLEKRVLDRPLADVRVVDMREEYAAAGPDVILSSVLCESLTARLAVGEQAIVLLNRRGFATSVVCRQCGSTLECRTAVCSHGTARAARAPPLLQLRHPGPEVVREVLCEYLSKSASAPSGSNRRSAPGFLKQEWTASIATPYAGAERSQAPREVLAGADILVGTQMLAKGHDFECHARRRDLGGCRPGPGGFSRRRRTFQLPRVAGRAGRGHTGRGHRADALPDHYSIRHACRQDYLAFYRKRSSSGRRAVSANHRPDQRRRAIADVRRGDAGCL